MNAKGFRPQHRQVNSFGEKWSTSVKENMARDRHNKLSRLVYRKRAAPV